MVISYVVALLEGNQLWLVTEDDHFLTSVLISGSFFRLPFPRSVVTVECKFLIHLLSSYYYAIAGFLKMATGRRVPEEDTDIEIKVCKAIVTPHPSLAIIRFWQGAVEILLRVTCMVRK